METCKQNPHGSHNGNQQVAFPAKKSKQAGVFIPQTGNPEDILSANF